MKADFPARNRSGLSRSGGIPRRYVSPEEQKRTVPRCKCNTVFQERLCFRGWRRRTNAAAASDGDSPPENRCKKPETHKGSCASAPFSRRKTVCHPRLPIYAVKPLQYIIKPMPGKVKSHFLKFECGCSAIPNENARPTKTDDRARFIGGGRWIRTTEGGANRFTVCPLWPLGNSPMRMR